MGIKIGKGGLSVDWITAATGGELLTVGARGGENGALRGLSTDTRTLRPGEIYLALAGERFDGHNFITDALKKGAAAVICNSLPERAVQGVYIVVGDTGRALLDMARTYKRELPRLSHTVAVTGSVGKTTTKQFIYSVLSQKYTTEKTEGNYNNLVGLPLTILSASPDCEALVLEMGMSAIGEISRMSLCAEPDTAVITNIGTAHIGMLGSRERIRDAKLEILDGLRPGGRLICTDEPLLAGIPAIRLGDAEGGITVGDISGTGDGTEFNLRLLGSPLGRMRIPVIGEHNVRDAAMAACVGLLHGLGEGELRSGLAGFKNVGARQNIEKVGGITAIYDCYNASPESMEVSLGVLRDTAKENKGRSVAVLGDMLELGGYSEQLHRAVGRVLDGKGVSVLYTYGDESRLIAEEAEPFVPYIRSFSRSERDKLVSSLRELLRAGDTVLFKASNGMGLGEVAHNALCTDSKE